jgi:predicted nucleic acid-binding protein
VRVVVADTGPLQYLVLIEAIDLLPRLFEAVSVPDIVRDELRHAHTPPAVRSWIESRPSWLQVVPSPPVEGLPLPALDDGERAAIALALSLRADLILMDDRAGVAAALTHGFEVTGTLGFLDRAARRGLIDFAASAARLMDTNFRYPPGLLNTLLARHRERDSGL